MDATPRDGLHTRVISRKPIATLLSRRIGARKSWHLLLPLPRSRKAQKRGPAVSLPLKRRNNRRCNPCEPGARDGLEESEFEEYIFARVGKRKKSAGRLYYGLVIPRENPGILDYEDIRRDVARTCALRIGADLILRPTSPSRRLTENLIPANKGITTERIKSFPNLENLPSQT